MNPKDRIELIKTRLENAFQPNALTIIDESHKHKGHAGAATGRGHFKVEIQSEHFDHCSKVQAHRTIYQALGTLMETDIHALSIVLKKNP